MSCDIFVGFPVFKKCFEVIMIGGSLPGHEQHVVNHIPPDLHGLEAHMAGPNYSVHLPDSHVRSKGLSFIRSGAPARTSHGRSAPANNPQDNFAVVRDSR